MCAKRGISGWQKRGSHTLVVYVYDMQLSVYMYMTNLHHKYRDIAAKSIKVLRNMISAYYI